MTDKCRPNAKKNLTYEERNGVLQALLEKSSNKSLPRGAIGEVANMFGVHRTTVLRIWSRGVDSITKGSKFMDVSSKIRQSGRKRKDYSKELAEYKSFPSKKRPSLRVAAAAFNIPKTTLVRRLQEAGDKRKSVSEKIRSQENVVKDL
ncbi:hypothetical protein NDN08_008150 [Rhodosorus marinus]|uniref:DUF7769 domain-containing protein n=1 Tax=Rhodosorus marinus TaxID=101924 RepID=A0AAV8V2E9_9RHOD|nr:hypothetical protein NDN08_008150 [Rhodosorus marinus]